jgi:hypothetical protein
MTDELEWILYRLEAVELAIELEAQTLGEWRQ